MISRDQAAQSIIACGEVVTQTCLNDPTWQRRRRHGDPTAIPDLVRRVGASLGHSGNEVLAAIAADATLSALLDRTVAMAEQQAEVERRPAQRLRRSLWIGLPLAVLICGVAYGFYCLYGNDPRVQQHAKPHPAATQPTP
jgi:hypothetical protein